VHVENFMVLRHGSARVMAGLGFRTIYEMVGRVERLDSQAAARALRTDAGLSRSSMNGIGRQIGR
jgi:hypothetical protein